MNRNRRIKFRCTEQDEQTIRDKADRAKLTLSEYLRRTALGRKVVSVVDREMVGELCRLGAMLKHFYPKVATWTPEEKRRYWAGHEKLMDLAQALQSRIGGKE
ncbi:MAG: hypothetical protein WBX11_16480 [Thiobacillaceae bacterium]